MENEKPVFALVFASQADEGKFKDHLFHLSWTYIQYREVIEDSKS